MRVFAFLSVLGCLYARLFVGACVCLCVCLFFSSLLAWFIHCSCACSFVRLVDWLVVCLRACFLVGLFLLFVRRCFICFASCVIV